MKTETIIRGLRVLEEIGFKTANTSAKKFGSKIYGCFGGVLKVKTAQRGNFQTDCVVRDATWELEVAMFGMR